jgi:aminoglycoside phosphotransferase
VRLARLAGAGVSELRLTGSQHQARHYRATLTDGRAVFVKTAAGGPAGALGAEARGLSWLGGAGAVPVPGVVGWDESMRCGRGRAVRARAGRDARGRC